MNDSPNNPINITIVSDKNIKYLLKFLQQKESLIIEANSIESIPKINYQKSFSLDEIKLNKYFKICDSIADVLVELNNAFNKYSSQIKISENANKLTITIPLPSIVIKEAVFSLDKIAKTEKEEIASLNEIIGILSEKVKSLEEKNEALEKELTNLKEKNIADIIKN